MMWCGSAARQLRLLMLLFDVFEIERAEEKKPKKKMASQNLARYSYTHYRI